MAESDWLEFSSSLSAATVARGVTAAITPPSGGGYFIYGWNSLVATQGAAAMYLDRTGFNPIKETTLTNATGGSIRGAVMRGNCPQPQTGFAPFLIMHAKSGISAIAPSVADTAYLLGLEDADPARILLKKTAPSIGFSADDSVSTLGKSSASYLPDTWVHLRLDCIYNQNGDVVIKCYQSDLGTYPVTTPDWQPIPGIADFIDDPLQVKTGSLPLVGGYMGFGFYSNGLQRRGYVDQIECLRQL